LISQLKEPREKRSGFRITPGKAEPFPQSIFRIHLLAMNGKEPCIVLADQKTSNAASFCTGELTETLLPDIWDT
jgi:hypothetical protein